MKTCKHCKGTGVDRYARNLEGDYCYYCKGSGNKLGKTISCNTCDGKGYIDPNRDGVGYTCPDCEYN